MRLRARAGAGFADAYADNGLNQYTAAGGLAVSHEARGNTTDIGAEAYGFNARNQLTTANAGDSLSYDPAGRLYEESGGAVTRFQYAGGEAIAEEDGAGAVLRRYVKGSKGAPTPFDGVDETLVWYEGSGATDRRWLVSDVRGSTIAETDGAGAASATYTYDEYGVPGAGNGGARMSYTGQMWLASLGLYHYKARAYNPATGRFMQPDPIGYGDGMNIYNYAGGDPVNFVDPFGLCSALPVYGGDNASVTFTYTGCGGGGGGGLTVASPAGTRSEKEADGTRERRKRKKEEEEEDQCPEVPFAPAGESVDENIVVAQKHPLDVFWFRSQVRNGGPWDYKQRDKAFWRAHDLPNPFEDFGNFNFGATGRAVGVPGQTLEKEAGRAQIQAGTSNPGWGTPGGRFFGGGKQPFGDDPTDNFQIRQGIEYFDRGCQK